MSTDIKHQGRRGLGSRPLVVAAIIGLLGVFLIPPAAAVHDDNLFELGGAQAADILGDGVATNGPDWADIFDAGGNDIGSGNFGGVAAAFLLDDTSQAGAVDRTTFSGAGGSNKNNDAISDEDAGAPGSDTWHWDSGNVPAKDDLTNVYAYATFNADNHLIFYAGFERLAPEGDSHVDIEFFKDRVSLDDPDGVQGVPCNDPGPDPRPCHFEGTRTVGDIIVSMDYVTGGGIGEVSLRTWNGTEYALVGSAQGEGCNTNPETICAFNNGGNIDGGPWINRNRHGAEIFDLPQNSFTEFGVDITEEIGGDPCITTVMGKTRSSQSFTAELKDFAGPEAFPICGANISIEPDDVNAVGEEHTFKVTVNQELGATEDPVEGVFPDVTLTDANGAAVDLISDGCADVGTDAAGECFVTFTSPTAGTVTGHAAADIDVAGENVHVETDGTGNNSDDAVKRFVDAKIGIAEDDKNSVGESHTFTVTVQQDDGTSGGFVPATVGNVDVTLTPTGGASVNLDAAASTCDDNQTDGDNLDSNGQCVMVFTSPTAGTVTGHAEVTLTFNNPFNGNVTVIRETDGTGGNTGDAVKDFVAGSLTWVKHDNDGNLLVGAKFTVCRTHDRFGTDIPDECFVDIVDDADNADGPAGAGLDQDGTGGEFKLTNLALGTWTITETVAPPGFEGVTGTQTVVLTILDPSGSADLPFVNQRPILKLTEFGYTNTPTGTPTSGVVSGTTMYTVKLKNFGGAAVVLSGSLVASENSVGGTLSCTGGNTLTIGTTLDPDEQETFTLSCTYTNLDDGSVVTAALSAITYTTNTVTRTASGTPASITFTVQSD